MKKENKELRKENEKLRSSKESLIDKISKRLLELKFEKHNSIKPKCLKWIVKKILSDYKKLKIHNQKIKPIKLGKRSGKMYSLECKDYNFRSQKVNMTNKVFREKSNCMVCGSNKSRFLKQKCNNKK